MGDLKPSRVLVVEPNDRFYSEILDVIKSRGNYKASDVRRERGFWDAFNYLFSIQPNRPDFVVSYLPFKEYKNGNSWEEKTLEEEGLERAFRLCDPKSWIINIGQIYVYTSEKNPSYKSRVFATNVLKVVRELFDGASFARDDRHLEELLRAQIALPNP